MEGLRRHQFTAFALVWLTYASTYLLRKPLGIVKMDLKASSFALGMLDVALLLPYGAVQMFASSSVDRHGPRLTISLCLLVAGISMLPFGSSVELWMFCVMLAINGAMQAPCWPACCKALSAWYPDRVMNSVIGILSTATYCGAFGGTALAVYMQMRYGYGSVYLPASAVSISLSVLVFLMLRSPADLDVAVLGKDVPVAGRIPVAARPKLSFGELWRLPLVSDISASVVCLKAVRYAMYMWLPIYFSQKNMYSKAQAGMLSTFFDVGGALGSPLFGFILDRYFQGRNLRGLFLFTSLSSVFMVLMMVTSMGGPYVSATMLLLIGATNGGADSLLAGSVSTSIGEEGGLGCGAGVTGLVNGLGTLGAVAEGPLLGALLSAGLDWDGVLAMLATLSAASAMFVARAWRKQRNMEAVRRFHMEHSVPSLT